MALEYLNKLKIILPDGARESDTQRDGLFSYAGEWHSFIIAGVATLVGGWAMATLLVGAIINEQVRSPPGRLNPVVYKELRREPWYGLGGVVGGLAGNQYLVSNGYLPEAQSIVSQFFPDLFMVVALWL